MRPTRTAIAAGCLGLASGLALAQRRLATGPRSDRADFRRSVVTQLAHPPRHGLIENADLEHLPAPVARYVQWSGAVGRPAVTNFRAVVHGRIRSGPKAPWMPFAGEQVNTCTDAASRLFLIVATMRGLPTEVYHRFVGTSATMRARVLSAVTVVEAHGPEMVRSETVTVLNDLCVMAPASLVGAAFTWEPVDDRTAIVGYERLGETVTATLHFDDDDRLVDFVSDDRSRAGDRGVFTSQRWSTPLRGDREVDGRRIAAYGEGRWHAPPPEGEFAYIEFEIDEISYNHTAPPSPFA